MTGKSLTFEQPLNEHMRACLRLEHLFSQVQENIPKDTQWESHLALRAILEITNVVDRPDLKSKLTNTMSKQASRLTSFQGHNHVDQKVLGTLLDKLTRILERLHATSGKLGQKIRGNDFLNQIRQYLYNPGGAPPFTCPAYFVWLQQPHWQRKYDLLTWLDEFALLKEIVDTILSLARQSTAATAKVAKEGFYQQSLNAGAPCELIRVALPTHYQLHPEISAGVHRLSIRFQQYKDIHEHPAPQQSSDDISFFLACCSMC